MKNNILLLTLIIIVQLFSINQIVSADDKICFQCNKEINNTFVKVNGYHFHPSHFICNHCNKTISGSSYYFENNKFYDPNCFQKISQKNCFYCSKVIKGEYSIYEKNLYHPDCINEETKLLCTNCNSRITGKYIVSDGYNYHNSCYEKYVALQCDLCKDFINGKYYEDLHGHIFHAQHHYDNQQCLYCNGYFYATSLHGGKIYEDKRAICKHCLKDAIFEDYELEEILEDVNNRLSSFDLDIPLEKVSIHLVSRDELAQLYYNTNHKTLGFTSFSQSKNILGMTLSRDINIYILYGMPRMWVIKTLAHEFNHVWQGLKSMDDKNDAYCEGSCNYTSYLVTKQYPDPIAQKLVLEFFKDDDPVYGEGFRRIVDMVEDIGIKQWIKQLSSSKSFPSGY